MADLHSEVPRRLMALVPEVRIQAIRIPHQTDRTPVHLTGTTEIEVAMVITTTATIQTLTTALRHTEDIRLGQEEDLEMIGVAGPLQEIITSR